MSKQPSSKYIETPILVLGFNRPDKILQLLERLRSLGARNVYVSLDGPRNLEEQAICAESRRVALQFSVHFNLFLVSRSKNLGCCLGVVAGLDWFFEQVDFGIIIEDDCFPEEDMLIELEKKISMVGRDTGIGMLTAHNPFQVWNSPILSEHFLIQGWATNSSVWREVRNSYFKMTSPQFSRKKRKGRNYSESIFWWANSTRARLGGIDTWDGIFADRMWRLGYKTLVPESNLVLNFGFDDRATHTSDPGGSIFVGIDGCEDGDFDQLLKKKYFKISRRHFFTAPLKVIFDFFLSRRRNFESILELDRSQREEYLAPN